MYDLVEFESEGAVLRGRHYPSRGPLVVMAHGFSATITMVADRFAEAFHRDGLGVLLYDHRNFGASDGEPRHAVNPWVQARGYRDALAFAAGLPEVSRTAVWGDSFSAAVALVVAAVDERVAAVVGQVPAVGSKPPPVDPDGERWAVMRETLLHGDIAGQGDEPTLPVVSADQLNAPSLLTPIQAYRWFIEYGGRFGTGWTNQAIRVKPRTPAPFHAGLAAAHVRCPVLFQISPEDEMPGADPAAARAVFAALAGPGELIEIDGGHFGLLHHPSRWFDDASRQQCEFLRRQLGAMP